MNKEITEYLFLQKDEKYRDFMCSLLPTVDPKNVIGVRTPTLRKMAKQFCKNNETADFIKDLPHKYYEENNLHGFIIENCIDFGKTLDMVENFLPYIDNWATCDSISPKALKKNLPELYEKIKIWVRSDHTYTVRFGICMLMKFYLGKNFKQEYLKTVADIKSDEYYINMAKAWFFATALSKHYEETVPYIEKKTLDDFTHNKSIQKAVESKCITNEVKIYLKSLKKPYCNF